MCNTYRDRIDGRWTMNSSHRFAANCLLFVLCAAICTFNKARARTKSLAILQNN